MTKSKTAEKREAENQERRARYQLSVIVPKGRLTATRARALKCGDVVLGASSGQPYLFLESQDIKHQSDKKSRTIKLWVKKFGRSAFTSDEEDKFGIGHVAFREDVIEPNIIASAVGIHFLTTEEARLAMVGDLVKVALNWTMDGERVFRIVGFAERDISYREKVRPPCKLSYMLVGVKYPDMLYEAPYRKVKQILRYPDVPELDSYTFGADDEPNH